jgi:hypothetical protein
MKLSEIREAAKTFDAADKGLVVAYSHRLWDAYKLAHAALPAMLQAVDQLLSFHHAGTPTRAALIDAGIEVDE